jgi:hypothetical protein
MERKILAVLGILAAAVLLTLTAVRAAETTDKGATNGSGTDDAARAAMEKADPDNVDPNTIKGEHWTYDFQYENPQPLSMLTTGGEKEVYWYVIYTITNTSDAEHDYVPSFLMFTDSGAVTKAGVYPAAFDTIKKERAAKYKFLENVAQMTAVGSNRIRKGPDNARTGVAIFPPLENTTQKFTIFVGGLSGEFVERPDRSDKKIEPGHLAEGDKLTRLFKTLALNFSIPGDKWWKNLDTPTFVSKKWTWR